MCTKIKVLCAVICLCSGAVAEVVFDLNSSTYDTYMQSGAVKQGNVTVSTGDDSYIDFDGDGILQIPGIPFPKGAFSIESRFNLKEYADSDPVISDLLGAYDCDFDGNGSTEGVNFRVGGGYNYPLCTKDAFNNIEEYIHPDYVTKMERATLSKCIGELALGVGKHFWKEIYTDRCIETDTWTHMVATWDGEAIRLFLNGHEATDEWRTIGVEEPVFINDTSALVFGAENLSAWRHFNGKIDFLRIHDNALTPQEIANRYNKINNSWPCYYQIILTSPKAGEVVTLSSKVNFSVVFDNECNDSVMPGVFTIQLSTDPSFTTNVINLTSNSLENTLADLLNGASLPEQGVIFIRVAAGSQGGLAKKTATVPIRSAPRPAYFVASPASIGQQAYRNALRVQAKVNGFSGSAMAVYDCRGRQMRAAAGPSRFDKLNNGIYLIKLPGNSVCKVVRLR